MSYYCHLSPKSWQFPLGVWLCTITKTHTNYHLVRHDCRNTSTSYWYLLLHVNIIVQAYISSIYCGNKHNVSSNDKFIFTCIFTPMICLYGQKFIHIICICYKWAWNSSDHKRCVYIDKSLLISRVLMMLTDWQNKDAHCRSKWHRKQSEYQDPDIQLEDLQHGMIHMIECGMKNMTGRLH